MTKKKYVPFQKELGKHCTLYQEVANEKKETNVFLKGFHQAKDKKAFNGQKEAVSFLNNRLPVKKSSYQYICDISQFAYITKIHFLEKFVPFL